MAQAKVDAWLILSREPMPDPLAHDLGADRMTVLGAALFVKNGNTVRRHALVVGFNVDPLHETGIYDEIEVYRAGEFWDRLNSALHRYRPRRIGVNISPAIGLADGLTAGLHQALQKNLTPRWRRKLVSSESLVIAFRSRRLPDEVALMRRGAIKATRILRQALSKACITPEVTTEYDLAEHIRRMMKHEGLEHAWDPQENPMINTGLLRGHAVPSTRVIKRGHLVKIDFCVSYHGLCVDLQRTVYVRHKGETHPPETISRLFRVTRRAIDLAVAAMKPGTPAYRIDAIARGYLQSEGFPSFRHATGHSIGLSVHDVGPHLGPYVPSRPNPMARLPLQAGQALCVEPAAPTFWPPLRGDIEVGLEDQVVVTRSGGRYLSPPQTHLWTI